MYDNFWTVGYTSILDNIPSPYFAKYIIKCSSHIPFAALNCNVRNEICDSPSESVGAGLFCPGIASSNTTCRGGKKRT
jgi:hypothetical protein